MSGELAILILTTLVSLLISAMVLTRGYKRRANVIFCTTAGLLVLWSIFNYLSAHLDTRYTTEITRITGALGLSLLASIYFLSTAFPTKINTSRFLSRFIYVTLPLVTAFALTSLMMKEATRQDDALILTQGSLYHVYTLYFIFLGALSIINFKHQYHIGNRVKKSQVRLLGIGLLATMTLGLASNIFMPAIIDNWSAGKNGSLFSIPFITITAYAIIKRRMFEVRLIITRTVAYALTIGFVALIYSLFVLFIANYVISLDELTAAQITTLLLPTLFIGLTFHSIQKHIDKITTRLFYRNAYDSQEILANLSDTLMSTNSIDDILKKSSKILSSAINSNGFYFTTLHDDNKIYKHYPINSNPPLHIENILKLSRKHHKALIEKDTLSEIDEQSYYALENNQIDLILRLGSRNQPIGFIIVGVKKNGGIYSRQDLQLLEISAKNLVVALENALKYEQILHFADTMHEEVNKATHRLKKANEKLRTLDALKDDFIATASHQLRTPAASVHDMLHLLNHPSLTSKDRKELTLLAEASSEHLVMVVRTMLNMARLQAGHFTIDKTAADLSTLVQNVVDQTKVVADQKSVKLKLIKPKQPLPVRVDVAKINEALSNYIENAIKYSPNKSTVDVLLEVQGKRIVIQVTDQGMGVPESEQKNLFKKFYRATNAREEQPDGNGIGLYVVKSIAEGHGGEAFYRSSEKGGSIFGLWIPND